MGGRVVALNQTVSAHRHPDRRRRALGGLIQADTAIRPGDSGGPLVNNAGQVVGMNTAATDSYKMSGGQGFAIPIGHAMGVAGAIRAGAGSNTVHIGPTAFLGMGVAENGGNGARVVRVVNGGPAGGTGIAAGDTIIGVDNVAINGPTSMTDVMVPHHPGDTITLRWRAQDGEHSAPVHWPTDLRPDFRADPPGGRPIRLPSAGRIARVIPNVAPRVPVASWN